MSSNGYITELPDDQWIQELRSWQASVWAAHQVMLVDYAIGPLVRDPLTNATYVTKPSNEMEKMLCGTQKMRKLGGFVYVDSALYKDCYAKDCQ